MMHHSGLEPPAPDTPFLPPDCLEGRIALVTGGASGLGYAMAMGLGRAGASVALLGRTLERTEAAAARLRAMGVRAIGLSADVRDVAAVREAFDRTEATLGRVSLLANNAGGNFGVTSETMSPNGWRSITRIALDGTVICTSVFAERFRAGRPGGVIVNNAANYVWSGFPGDAHSSSAKAAVVGFTRRLALQLKPVGIRVNAIAAGFFPHAAGPTALDPERVAARAAAIPVGRAGQMQEIGWAAALICSDYAKAMNGETLLIDGGYLHALRAIDGPFEPPRGREKILK